MEVESLRVAMFSTRVTAGAGSAALRVHDALRLGGAHSTLYVGRGERSRHPGVRRLRDAAEGCQPARVPGLTIFSVDAPGISDTALDQIIESADVFNLHWYARFLSVRNIERLSRSGKPMVLTIRDMIPLSGGCHYFHGCENWKRDCSSCPQFVSEDLRLPHATFEAKRALWEFDNITAVVLSDHTAKLVERSPLLANCRVEKIPNPIDVSIFKPHDRKRTRAEFGLPMDKRLIAYLPSFNSSVKGAAQAVEALRLLASQLSADDCAVLCAGELDGPLDVPFETVNLGFVTDKRKLARFYSAADVTLISSTEETFSNTAAESVSCGTPIVGFRVGAIPEIAQGPRGRAVHVNDTEALADALKAYAACPTGTPSELHRYVTETFDASVIGTRYLKLFDELCEASALRSGKAARPALQAPAGFDRLLRDYQETRAGEIRKERKALLRSARSPRGAKALVARAIRLFFIDNQAFRHEVRSMLSKRR